MAALMVSSILADGTADKKSSKTFQSERPQIKLTEPSDESIGVQRNVRAGFVSTFTQKFFTDYNALLMDFMVQKMRSMETVDMCNEYIFGQFFSTSMCTNDIRLSEFEINIPESNLTILDEQKALGLQVSGIDLQFDFGFKIWSDPEWLHDDGTGMISIKNAGILITLNPSEQDGILQVSFSEVKINIEDYQVELNGTSDLSEAIEILFKNFKQFFKEELTNMLAWRLAKSVEDTLNNLLVTNGEVIDVTQQQSTYLNATLLQDPIFNKGFISFPVDGKFLLSGDVNQKSKKE